MPTVHTTSLTPALISLQKIYVRIEEREILKQVDFELHANEIVTLIGPNGAGKSTLIKVLLGIMKPTSGKVFISDIDITRLPINERADLGISYLAQEASIFRKLTVEDNLRAILQTRNLSKKEQDKKIDDLLEEFNITHIRTRLGMQLSGGERRRVEIARGLALEPHFILLDEPFAGIDPLAVADIQGIISYLKERGMGILITDHNVRETLQIVDRAYIMNSGQILLEGDSDTIANSELARKFYLGEDFKL